MGDKMPTYDYQCENCGHTFEETLKIDDRNKPTESPCTQEVEVQETEHMTFKEVCGGEVKQILFAPYFGYDNIKTRHSQNNKVPSWYTDKIKDLKKSKRFPGNTL